MSASTARPPSKRRKPSSSPAGALGALGDRAAQVRPVAVEVAAAGQLGPAQLLGVDELVQADRIGIGHQHDLAADQAIVVGAVEQAPEVVRHQEPRRLVGVECGLDVHFGLVARPAVAVHGHEALGPRPAGGEGQASSFTGHGALLSCREIL
jgi:hypothetical protein